MLYKFLLHFILCYLGDVLIFLKKLISLLVITLLVGISTKAESTDFDIPAINTAKLSKKELWATYYHIWHTQESDAGTPLLNVKNEKITDKIPVRDWCMGAIQGTISVTTRNGRNITYNYADHKGPQQVDCAKVLNIDASKKAWIIATGKSRFQVAQGEYGDGVRGYKLIPFRTIAVDTNIIPYGSVIYVPQARGSTITLPSGMSVVHDGYFFAGDKGGAIKGQHIDIFSGISSKNPFPKFVKSSAKYTFEAYIVSQKSIVEKLERLHRDTFSKSVEPNVSSSNTFKRTIVEIANQEWIFFGRQTYKNDVVRNVGKKENMDSYWQRIVQYWQGGPNRSDVDTKKEVSALPWSAAFVSFVMRKSGAGNKFKYSSSHYTYIIDAIRNRKNGKLSAPFVGYKTSERNVEIGDLVCAARGDDANKVTYENALTYADKSEARFFQSHCDIVTAIRTDEVDVIGGNVSDSVTKTTLTTRDGKIIPTSQRKWFVVIKNNG